MSDAGSQCEIPGVPDGRERYRVGGVLSGEASAILRDQLLAEPGVQRRLDIERVANGKHADARRWDKVRQAFQA